MKCSKDQLRILEGFSRTYTGPRGSDFKFQSQKFGKIPAVLCFVSSEKAVFMRRILTTMITADRRKPKDKRECWAIKISNC